MSEKVISMSLFEPQIIKSALVDSFKKLTPQQQWRNPVMFVVYLGSLLTTLLWIVALNGGGKDSPNFILSITLWLWGTVLFANFAEAVAEGRSKAQASFLRSAKRDISAKKLVPLPQGSSYVTVLQNFSSVASPQLRRGDVVLIEAGDFVPGDGEVIEGVASVDESADRKSVV